MPHANVARSGVPSQPETPPPTSNPSSAFVSMALDMSWRLAIVVLVPIIGGFQLDQHLHDTPLLTICGFLIAMAGTGIVMWQVLQTSNQVTNGPRSGKKS